MIDWTASMQQTYEYYTVDPNTWKDVSLIDNVKTSMINWDSSVATLGSATIDVVDSLGECYVRIYLVVIQNGVRYRLPLGTFLVQTPSSSFNGKIRNVSMDAYTPLLELKENLPPIGYSALKDDNIMELVCRLTSEYVRAPVVSTESPKTLTYDFVANADDTWLTFLSDLMSDAKYTFGLDELGRVLFSPVQDTASLQPVWTYTDDNSSILYPDFDMNHDLFGIPNVVEVSYSSGSDALSATAINNDANSPISTINRGRKIVYRDSNPSLYGEPTQEQLDEYAKRLLKEMSTLEYTITYTHGYCPVRLGDCVRLNFSKAGLTNVKAKVVYQSIKCKAGCPVTEKAVFTTKLWG